MDYYYVLSALAAVVAVLTAVSYVWRHFRRFTSKVDTFLDDWYGKPARPEEGVEQQKGVMLRLKDQDDTLAYLKKELSFNGSHSIKDVVTQSAVDIRTINAKLDVIEKRRVKNEQD